MKNASMHYAGGEVRFNSIFPGNQAKGFGMKFPPATTDFEVSVADLNEWLSLREQTPLRLVDCREEDEFALCKLESAEFAPLSRFAEEASERFGGENPDTPIVIYCHHGMRSLQATMFLRQRGIDQVWSLAGGIDAWSVEIDPDVTRY
ncbi:MAG: rhodanese-like domain-containing protein [Verrucomicrobiota bacterium]